MMPNLPKFSEFLVESTNKVSQDVLISRGINSAEENLNDYITALYRTGKLQAGDAMLDSDSKEYIAKLVSAAEIILDGHGIRATKQDILRVLKTGLKTFDNLGNYNR